MQESEDRRLKTEDPRAAGAAAPLLSSWFPYILGAFVCFPFSAFCFSPSFAQAAPQAGAFLQWWIILAFLAGVAANVVAIVNLISNRKQRREVNFAFEPASKEAFDKHVEWNNGEHEKIWAKVSAGEQGCHRLLDARLEVHRNEHREDMQLLHEEINEVTKKVAGLETATSIQNQTLAQITTKVDRIAERLPLRHA